MPQTYETVVSGTTTFGALYGKINNLAEALRSAFSGTSFPTTPTPVEGQFCYRTDEDKLYIYRNTAWEEIPLSGTLWQEIINARGTKPSIDQRLDVAINEDGSLKAATTLNPSQWYKPSLTFTYVSTTSFTVNGDQRDIYKPTRRLKINLSASIVYSEVVSAAYTTVTTITVLDAVINNTLIDVEHSLFLPKRNNGALSFEMVNNRKSKSITAAYTTSINDHTILCDASSAAFNVTAVSAATLGAGGRQTFKKIDAGSNVITLVASGTEKLDGFSKLVLEKFGESVTIESDGANFRIINNDSNKLTAADLISDYVVSGLLGTDPGASLIMTIPGGTAYVMGRRVAKSSADADLTKTYTASKDTYVDISNAGVITYSEVANGAAAPAVAANSIRLEKVVTNATEITGITDLRQLALGLSKLLNLAKGADIASATVLNLSTATGNLVHITGITPTTGVTMISGQQMLCIADGEWPLTYHATNLKLNTGGANYTCAAGDMILFTYDGTTVYGRIIKQDGTVVVGGAGFTGKFFTAYQSAAQAIAQTTWTKITLDTEVDADGVYDAVTNYRVVIPNGETWMLHANVTTLETSANWFVFIAIYKNGVIWKRNSFSWWAEAGNEPGGQVSGIATGNGTDYYEVFIYRYNVAKNTAHGEHATYFYGYRVK